MSEPTPEGGLRDFISARGEQLLGKITQDLLENGSLGAALTRAFEARGKATAAQQLAMGMLNIPSAADVERLTRRVRAVSERLEAIEDGLSRVEVNIARAGAPVAARLAAIEEQLADTTRLLGEIQAALPGEAPAVSRDQERLRVEAEPIATEPTSWFSRATPLD